MKKKILVFFLAVVMVLSLASFASAGETEPVAEIEGKGTFATLAAAVEAAETDDTIMLLRDAEGDGIVIDKKITIDFDKFENYTYTFNGNPVDSEGTNTLGFQILEEAGTVTLQNGTLKFADSNEGKEWNKEPSNKGFAMMIQNYANLNLTGMTLDGTKVAHNGSNTRYVMSINSGKVVIGNTTITAAAGGYAFDTCKYGTYSDPTVEVKGNSIITGNVGLAGGNLTLTKGTLTAGSTIVGNKGEGVVTKKDGFTFIIK